jgi:HK97 family phage portal protein
MSLIGFFTRKKKKASENNVSLAYLRNILSAFNDSIDATIREDATSFAAIDLIASSFACLSGSFYDKTSRQAVKEHYLYELLQSPNIEEDKFLFFCASAKDYYSGNVYWYKYEQDNEIVSLFRLNPAKTRVQRDPITNRKIYIYGKERYTDEQVIHIPSRFGYNGLVGSSISDECKSIFSNNAEIDNYVKNTFNNNIGDRLVIDISKKYPKATPQNVEDVKRLFNEGYTGIKNAGKPLIKSDLEYSVINTNTKDNRANQLIENRAFQEQEIAKLFRIPMALLKGDKADNIEYLYTMFIENAIRPLATSFEQAINRLIPYTERRHLYFEYSYNSLTKTSLQTRIDAYVKQLTNGILNINEVRGKENLPGIDAGDYHFFAANMMPVTEEVIQSYMAKSKAAQQDLESKNDEITHDPKGDDKT